jgi:hypothetical protein
MVFEAEVGTFQGKTGEKAAFFGSFSRRTEPFCRADLPSTTVIYQLRIKEIV